MPPFLVPFALLIAFFRELWDTFKDPRYRGLLLWVGVLLVGGTVFYRQVEGWSWVDAVYFCVITLATIGFGDLTPTTPAAKIFTIVYVFIGLSFFVSFFNLLAKERKAIYRERTDQEGGEGSARA